ncbi:hypothetical protein Nhal_2763 [Nitrosococcus halophilus Nc 4]|uniref:Uncharacterized protein n=1 Tax=Nitrosococcus halophilus (strain Nc4) TaxID=472759 RepID=D5BXE7_NITHN|nr:hypothetical protein Nhal_2763 [Nitrosococcus halophilus Nc 4]
MEMLVAHEANYFIYILKLLIFLCSLCLCGDLMNYSG